MDSNTATESDIPFNSQSFFAGWMIDDKCSKDAMKDSNKHSFIWTMFMFSTLEAFVFMAKELHRKFTFHQKYRCSTFEKDDRRTKRWDFMVEWLQLTWKMLHGNIYLWLVMKSSVSGMQRFMYFQILCHALEWWAITLNQILLGKKKWAGSNHLRFTETLTESTVSQLISSGIFAKKSPQCSSATKSMSSWSKIFDQPEE